MNTTTSWILRPFGRHICLLVLMLSFVFSGWGQNTLFSETFTGGIPNDWVLDSIDDTGPDGVPHANWAYTNDGTAKEGAYWEGRPAIESPTGSTGAIVFDSDFLDNGGRGNPLDSSRTGASWAPHEGAIISPRIPTKSNDCILFQFNQYLRIHQGKTFVDVSVNNGLTWDSIQINTDLSSRPYGGETSNSDTQFVNISSLIAGEDSFQLRLRFQGSYYFWIVDDLKIIVGPESDLATTDLIWPNKDYSCVLGQKEHIQIKLKNIGKESKSNFIVFYSINGGGGVFETILDTLSPNEELIYTFDTFANLDSLHTLLVGTRSPDGNPDNDLLTQTFEPYRIEKDSFKGEFIYNHLIVEFSSTATPDQKTEAREEYEATVLDVCSCDSIELWEINYPISPYGDSIFTPEEALNSMIPNARAVSFNYLFGLRPPILADESMNFRIPASPDTKDTVIVAVIDTGLDFDHDSLKNNFWINQGELKNKYGADTDNNCVRQDNRGYNRIDPERDPYDDDGHGTSVGGSVLSMVEDGVFAVLLTIKALAQNQRGTLFDIACGLKYAEEKEVDIINMSMGYRGEESEILGSIFSDLKENGILVVTSAGNDTSNNELNPHWPSNFKDQYDNVLSVAAVDATNNLATFSNYSSELVDIAALGVNVLTTALGNNALDERSGTSISAALVSGALATIKWSDSTDSYIKLKDCLFEKSFSEPKLIDKIAEGRVLNPDWTVYLNTTCKPVSILEPLSVDLRAFPNPFHEYVKIEFELTKGQELEIQVFNMLGETIYDYRNIYSSGSNEHIWHPTDLPSGFYAYRILSEGTVMAGGILWKLP